MNLFTKTKSAMENKKSEFCFVCNTKTQKYCQNLRKIIIKSTGTRLSNLIEKFLNEVGSERQVNDVSNVLCFDCLRKLLSYDQMVLMINNSEKELRDLLSKTEFDLLNKPIEPDESQIVEIETLPDDLIENEKLIENPPIIEDTESKYEVFHESIPVDSSQPLNDLPPIEKTQTDRRQTYSCEECNTIFDEKTFYMVSSVLFY